MSVFKHRILILAMAVVFIFSLGAAVYGAAVEKDEIYGRWECFVETDEAEDFIFFLYFTAPNAVIYAAGWHESEIAAIYTGEFTIDADGFLKLDMTEQYSSDNLTGTFTFEVSEGTLVLTKQSGDGLSYMFEAGEPMKFTTASSTWGFITEAVDPDIYINIPDSMFPIPMLDGIVIPYSRFTSPEEGYEVTSYIYDGESFMESYREQLHAAGFIDNGSAGWIESLWRYDRDDDGASLIVEMFHEDGRFAINMYVNYLD